ncbi:NAD(P)-dependent oxidoreductase [Microbacterium esteraromaticum]|uniref:NAD(P)-dependent oxidoreductase n=1 Tax=Microbacterium esteraromaticum TaxID=57043 RepID=A0A7D8A822_9MICO|nr:NAD(P)-dependent oxidoreductase [Microbacterium esteraromaticum]QMU96880.1 NAD(P)-dependent oxidoreductase [Microbacterium esteraromaticum]
MSGESIRADGFTSEQELEDALTEPRSSLIDDMRRRSGDLVLLGAGGKMGPTLAILARRAMDAAGRTGDRVYAVSRFGDGQSRDRLEAAGVTVIPFDLVDSDDLSALPDADDVIFMVGAKFGAATNASWAWEVNAALPDRIARRYRGATIVVFSTGNVYPFVAPTTGGADETTTPAPIGEYAQSCLGRERVFEFAARERGTSVAIVRLNYAVDLRYGVLADIGQAVASGEPVSLATANVNVVWQGYANEVVLRSLGHAAPEPFIVNLAGPELLSVEKLAREFGLLLHAEPVLEGQPESSALLSDSTKCMRLFGYPDVSAAQLVQWQAQWIQRGLPLSSKPTKWAVRDGRF